MARKPSKYPHGGRDAHSVERAERRSRPVGATIAKDRRRLLRSAAVAARTLSERIQNLGRNPDPKYLGKWQLGDVVDVRIFCGDPVADVDALTESIEALVAIRDKLDALHDLGRRGSC